MLERFKREARAASALNHPNICTIHSVEEFAGQPVIVMELLEGETLAERLARGPMPRGKGATAGGADCRSAGRSASQTGCASRSEASERNADEIRCKVLDFGLAKVERAVAVGEDSPTQTTQVGAILGTLHYMSPEQVQGKEADARSDIFSFGCVLLEMVSGKRGFTGETAADLMSAILTKDPVEGVADTAKMPPGMPPYHASLPGKGSRGTVSVGTRSGI